jgi:two-component system phosphate regulon response regulator PhoB
MGLRRAKSPSAVQERATEGLRMLVVDDDAYMRLLCSFELSEMDILEAGTVGAGFEVADADRPDVVVVDVRLAGGDGLDLVRRLRRSEATSSLPILVVTAGHDEGLRLEAVRAGADEYLAKPVDPEELRVLVAGLLASTGSERQANRMETLRLLVREHDATL